MPEPHELPPTNTQSDHDALASAVGGDTVPGAGARPDPDAPPFRPSEHAGELGCLGRYRVLKKLGQGGMGAVYLAFDEGMRRRIALKVMLPRFAAVPTARERFLREARTCAGVTSEHVVTVFDVDEANGVPFIAMEYLQGYPLDEYLRQSAGRLTVPQVLRVGREVALGLAEAHAVGLVHRDIKPANIWLEYPKGRIKILDFGLAKAVVSADEESSGLTNTGAVVGTPAYMSPEQARGLKVDYRTDLFSLGAVLYRLGTGRLPFPGPNAMAILTALAVDTPPPLRTHNPDAPAALDDLIHRLLAKDPAHRPASAADVAAELLRMEHTQAVGDLSRGDPVALSAASQAGHVPIPAAEGSNAFEGLDEPSDGSGASRTSAPPDRSRPERPRRSSARVWAAAVIGLAVLAALGVGVWRKFNPPPVQNQPDEPALAAAPAPPPPPRHHPAEAVPPGGAFFNGQDLTGWKTGAGGAGTWSVERGELVCRTPPGEHGKSQLIGDRAVRDFLLRFEVRAEVYPDRKGSTAYLFFRHTPKLGSAVLHLNPPGGLNDSSTNLWKAFPGVPAPPRASRTPAAPDGYNTVSMFVAGKRLTLIVNDFVLLEHHELPLADVGTFLWQPDAGVAELRVRNVRFADFSNMSVADVLTSSDWEWTRPEPLGGEVNAAGDAQEPTVSADGLRLVYLSVRNGEHFLYEASRRTINEPFGAPWRLDELGGGGKDHIGQPCLTADGLGLYFTANPWGERSAIWGAQRTDRAARWGAPAKPNPTVNTGAVQGPAVSADELTLYFTRWIAQTASFDVLVCRRPERSALWGAAELLGPDVNTDANERRPWALPDGTGFTFSREKGSGPGPVWLATKRGGWAVRQLFVLPPNGHNPVFAADGRTVYFDAPGGKGGTDLWQMRRVPKALLAGR
jgi:serine/threonine protein kinase